MEKNLVTLREVRKDLDHYANAFAIADEARFQENKNAVIQYFGAIDFLTLDMQAQAERLGKEVNVPAETGERVNRYIQGFQRKVHETRRSVIATNYENREDARFAVFELIGVIEPTFKELKAFTEIVNSITTEKTEPIGASIAPVHPQEAYRQAAPAKPVPAEVVRPAVVSDPLLARQGARRQVPSKSGILQELFMDWLSTKGIFGAIYTIGSLLLCIPVMAYLLYSDSSMINTLSLGLIGSPENKPYWPRSIPGVLEESKSTAKTASDPLTLEARAIFEEYYKKAIISCEGRYYFIEPKKNSITEIRDFSIAVNGRSIQGIDRDLNNIEWTGGGGISAEISRDCALTGQASCGLYQKNRRGFLGVTLYYTLSLRKMRNKPWALSGEITEPTLMSCEEIKKHPIWKEPE